MAIAEYISVTKEQCYETTRTGIRDSIFEFLNRHNSRFVWLQGPPGSGKTAIAKSIANTLAKNKRLAASFFWDKTGSRANADSIEMFPSTLASQLARFNRDYEMLLANILSDWSARDILTLPLEMRMDSLVVRPMRSISQAFWSAEPCPVVVLDGLDECGSRHALGELMKMVVLLDKLPPEFMILVSARREPEIRRVLERTLNIPRLHTDKISEADTNHTIKLMVEHGLAEIPQPPQSNWSPSEDDVRAFVGTCRQLPVLAEIRVREVRILASYGDTFKNAFHIVKDNGALSRDLNDDYLRILRRAYMRGNVYHSASHSIQTAVLAMPNNELTVSPHVLRTYQQVVGTVIAARKPLSVQTMSNILAISEGDIRAVLDPIGSIINAPISDDDTVHFYHATAKEFLIGPPQGDDHDRGFFFTDIEGDFLALPLLKVLNCKDNLKRDSGRSVRVGKHIAYAAEHWLTHLNLSSVSGPLWEELRLFLTTKLLFWIALLPNPVDTLRAVLKQREVSKHTID